MHSSIVFECTLMIFSIKLISFNFLTSVLINILFGPFSSSGESTKFTILIFLFNAYDKKHIINIIRKSFDYLKSLNNFLYN